MWYLYRVSQTTHLAAVAFKWANVKTFSTETPFFEPKELYVSWFKVREISQTIAQPEGTYNLLAWNTNVKRCLWWWDTSIEFIWSPAWISKWYKCMQTVKTETAFSLIHSVTSLVSNSVLSRLFSQSQASEFRFFVHRESSLPVCHCIVLRPCGDISNFSGTKQ